jgi:16S rRNA (uracil1498-N3)-methyltransferase
MTTHRFFLSGDAFVGDRVAFPADVAHQIRRVLRLRSGEIVVALDGSGMEYLTRLEIDPNGVAGTIEQRRPNEAEPAVFLTLYIGMLKGHKLELVLQKCTEVGVSRFVPVVTERSVAQEPSASRQGRFEAIVREAAEQSGRGIVPKVGKACAYGDALAVAVGDGPTYLFWEGERDRRMGEVASRLGRVSFLIGPEGGFSDQEVRLAAEAGAKVLSLGPRVLRSETAAIVGAALLLSRLDPG